MHLCFLNDGSLDNTMEILTAITVEVSQNSSIIDFDKNLGKAEAIRRGILLCRERGCYDFIGFLDADMATPLEEVEFMLAHGNNLKNYLMLSGCRVKRLGAFIDRRPMRHYLGRLFATTASFALRLPVYDTQCGAKIFRSSVVKRLFEKPFISKWFFDVEIFARICHAVGREETLNRVMEVPLTAWQDVGGSKVSLLQYFIAPIDLLRIYVHYVLLNRV
jgi:glycosyltransferase involved in cell wall biosynthesis